MYKIMHVDLETENHDWYGNVASAFNPANYVVAPGWRVDTVNDDGTVTVGETHYRYFGTAAEADDGADWFDALNDCAIMVCHNAQFEIKWFLSKYRPTFEAFLKRGGRIACTALAEYLLSHQQDLYPSLDETAVKHGGTHKVDGVKILWEQGYLTSQIDKALLIEYLAGPSGDIDNTALTFYSQQRQLAEWGMTQMYWERCDALLAFAYCEWFGLYVDRDVAERNLAAQEAEIAELTEKLRGLLPTDLPPEVEFNWGSDYHMSALVYGGPVKYRHKVPYDPPQYVKADFYKTETDGTMVRCDDPLLNQELIATGQHNFVRFKAGKNKGQIKVFREDTSDEKLKWEDTSVVLPGLVNLNSLPEGIREKYIGKRAEFKGTRVLCDGVTPVYSTSTDALKGLKNFVPEVGLMVKRAALEKDTGTYYLRTEYNADGTVKNTKGMMQYIGPDGIVHHSLNVTATVTTRLSSNKPNLQNLPRDGTSNVKEMFTSRFGADGRIVEVDYSALEVVMLCAMTKDTDLLALLQAGTDMHCYRLAFRLGEPYEDVLEKYDNEDHPQHKEYKQMRTDIKPLSFADQYGATAGGIAFNVGCTVEFAEQFQENEMKMFPISRGFRQVIADEVERTGALPSGIHREMGPSGFWQVYRRGYFRAPSTTCYSFRQHPQWDKEARQEVMKYKATQMANYPFQGESGFMMSSSMGRICRWLISKDWFDGKVCLINNVHDAAYLDVADEEVGREAALGVKAIMEDAPRHMTALWPEYDMADVPFPAAAEMGPNMQHKTHIH
ncbi:DNA polymerase [Pectobacterium phage PPWS2]|uniref:DNA polymerase n=1 Tax=Pectobacterium phage PPWS2 TaxID=2153295 RepID=A0A3G9DSU5_9CAUD|nr:DNA polymerase [Pectobacterium phage PPWS2]BBD74659.1 DNA polymerase [Pectobacterium phage PPWS2]